MLFPYLCKYKHSQDGQKEGVRLFETPAFSQMIKCSQSKERGARTTSEVILDLTSAVFFPKDNTVKSPNFVRGHNFVTPAGNFCDQIKNLKNILSFI
jgi:hypothetical protein